MLESMSLLAVGMPDLSVFQYAIVDNIFSMTVATMGAAALFLFLSRSSVDEAYRPALMVSGLDGNNCLLSLLHDSSLVARCLCPFGWRLQRIRRRV